MIEIKDKSKCCGCFGCEQICPKAAITMKNDREGFWYPDIDIKKCINCGLCDSVCPQLHPEKVSESTQVFAAYRKDFEKRLKSASGGIFAVIAEQVIKEGGSVFGAAFNKNFELNHIEVNRIENLYALQGSKYVQSRLSDSYSVVKERLNSGIKVLFSGTPCQVSGLKKFLNKEYENLLTMDLVCHGVPSPKVWKKYISELGNGENLISFTQRAKENGISKSYLEFEFSDGKVLKQGYNENIFMKGFNQNLFLRPSCYDCGFKGTDRCSDITIGDFWGFEKFHPEFFDDFGISLVMVHSNKGMKALNDASDSLMIMKSTSEEATNENLCITSPVAMNKKRDAFFESIENNSVIKSIKKYTTKASFKSIFWKVYDSLVAPLWKIKNKVFSSIKR